jgi:hypothetical protein
MAGGGLTTPPAVVKGQPYLIAYWDYFSDGIDPTKRSLQIRINGDSLFNLQEMYICNHPWPFYGNIYGDGFARALDSIGDYFRLIIHGVTETGAELIYTETLEYYCTSVTSHVCQSPDWKKISFRNWNNLKFIYFTMESTDHLIIDGTDYGPNTAVYFNMDKLKVELTGKTATNAVVQKAKASTTPNAIEIADYFPIPSYTGGDAFVYDAKGKEVFKTAVKAGEKVNLSKLPAGEYRLRHGHRYIPIKKVK